MRNCSRAPAPWARWGARPNEEVVRLRVEDLGGGPLRRREFHIWGVGRTGKRLARELEAHELRPLAFFDVDKSKQVARGRPVLREENLPPPGAAFMVCAVGAAGAREEIRALLESRKYLQGEHFLFAA